MLRSLFILVLLMLGVGLNAQTTFSKVYDHFERQMGDAASNVEKTSYGYLIFSTGRSENGEGRLGVRGIDYEGNSLFENEFGEEGTYMYSGFANEGAMSFDGNYIEGASIELIDTIQRIDPALLKFNEQGELLNSYVFEDNDIVYTGRFAFEADDSSYCLLGAKLDSPDDLIQGYVIKVNEDFAQEWLQVYSGEFNESILLYNGIKAHDGGFLFGGRTIDHNTFGVCESLSFEQNPLVIKTDSAGNEEWRKYFGTCRAEISASLSTTPDGNYVFCSTLKTDEISGGGNYFMWPYIAKIDPEGEIIWENTYGENNYDCALTRVSVLSDGNIISAGYRDALDINIPHRWGLLIKINQNGDSLWYRKYKFADDTNCHFKDVIETSDGGFIACGRTNPSEENPSYDTWVVKTDEYGCIVPGCHIGVEEFTKKYGSFKVGPNPVSQSENLVVFLPDVKDLSGLSFQLRNLSGQLVKSFVPDEGGTSYLIRTNGLSKGMYVLSLLKDGTEVQSEKVVVN